jgi:hypothetical protein
MASQPRRRELGDGFGSLHGDIGVKHRHKRRGSSMLRPCPPW